MLGGLGRVSVREWRVFGALVSRFVVLGVLLGLGRGGFEEGLRAFLRLLGLLLEACSHLFESLGSGGLAVG